jgi:hypothetical protein
VVVIDLRFLSTLTTVFARVDVTHIHGPGSVRLERYSRLNFLVALGSRLRVSCVIQNVEAGCLDLFSGLLHFVNISARVDGRTSKGTDLRLGLRASYITAVHSIACFLWDASGCCPKLLLRVPNGIFSLRLLHPVDFY